jgi:hypothetical protein
LAISGICGRIFANFASSGYFRIFPVSHLFSVEITFGLHELTRFLSFSVLRSGNGEQHFFT